MVGLYRCFNMKSQEAFQSWDKGLNMRHLFEIWVYGWRHDCWGACWIAEIFGNFNRKYHTCMGSWALWIWYWTIFTNSMAHISISELMQPQVIIANLHQSMTCGPPTLNISELFSCIPWLSILHNLKLSLQINTSQWHVGHLHWIFLKYFSCIPWLSILPTAVCWFFYAAHKVDLTTSGRPTAPSDQTHVLIGRRRVVKLCRLSEQHALPQGTYQ